MKVVRLALAVVMMVIMSVSHLQAWWEWMNPQPQGFDLVDGMGFSLEEAVAVGNSGAVCVRDAAGWQDLSNRVPVVNLTAVWGDSSVAFMIAGEDGYTAVLSNGYPSAVPLPEAVDVTDLWGISMMEVAAVTDSGQIWWFDGLDWTEMPAPDDAGLLQAIWGRDHDDFYVAGEAVFHWDGTQWLDVAWTLEFPVVELLGFESGNLAAAVCVPGEYSGIYRFDGAEWTEWCSFDAGTDCSLWGNETELLYAAAAGTENGTEMKIWNGTQWSDVMVELPGNRVSLFGDGSAVFAAGTRGRLMHHLGKTWGEESYGWSYQLRGVWADDSGEVFTAGCEKESETPQGVVMHYDGADWSRMDIPDSEPLNNIWGFPGGNVYAVGEAGTILMWDGLAWQKIFDGAGAPLWDLWGSSPEDMYFVGSESTIIHYDGVDWEYLKIGFQTEFKTVWGTGPDDVWLGGGVWILGLIVHFDGMEWTEVQFGFNHCRDIWGTGPDDVYAVSGYYDGDSVIEHWDGLDWQIMALPDSSMSLRCIQGTAGEVMASGRSGIVRKDGNEWRISYDRQSGDNIVLAGAHGQFWAVSESGFAWNYDGLPLEGVMIDMPEKVHPGELFQVTARAVSHLSEIDNAQFYFALEVLGSFYFYPEFTLFEPDAGDGVGFETFDFSPGSVTDFEIFNFEWPDTGEDAMEELRFYAAVVDPAAGTLAGEMAVKDWGFGPE